MTPLGRKIFGAVLTAGMASACYWSLRLAYADRLGSSDSPARVQAALQLAPGNAAYWLHWADLKQAGGQSGGGGFERATQTDPYNATAWIRAGLDAEMNGDFMRAERDLLLATERSRQFEPRWTLANYYFRRGDVEHFWPWAKSALSWAYSDRKLLFDLCWKMQPDASVILARAIPEDLSVERDYLDYLLRTDRTEAAIGVARRVEGHASPKDRDLLLKFTDRMLNQHQFEAALSAWNALCLRHVLPYPAVDPAAHLLTNGSFEFEPVGAGFDWHISQVSGITAEHSQSHAGIRFDFSGDEPEAFGLLFQLVPVAPGGRYALRFRFRTAGIPPASGLQWRITDPVSGREMRIQPFVLASENWSQGSIVFQAAAQMEAARIALIYRREPGTVLLEGSAWIHDIKVDGQR